MSVGATPIYGFAVLRQLMKTIASLRRASLTENYGAAVVEVRCVTFTM
jgi:hypothetical protein